MALFALQAAADAGEPRVRLNPWRDWPPRRGSARRLRLHVAEHRLQAEQAGIAQGAQFRRGGCRRGFPCRAADPGAGPAPARWHGRQGAGANGGSAALDGMQGRGAAWTSPSPSWRSSWAKVLHVRNEAPHLDDQLRAAAETPDDIAPRLDQFARVRCRCRRAWRRSCRDDRAGKAPGAPCRSASPHGGPARRQAASRSASEALAVMAGSAARRSARRRGFSGRLETIDIRHLHVHQHRVERHARLQHLLNVPARRRRGHPGALAAQQLGGDGGSARLSSTPADARPATAGCALHQRGGGLARAPLFAVQRMQHRVGQLLGRDRLGENRRRAARCGRAHQPAPRGHRR